jgi:hypothetical protein
LAECLCGVLGLPDLGRSYRSGGLRGLQFATQFRLCVSRGLSHGVGGLQCLLGGCLKLIRRSFGLVRPRSLGIGPLLSSSPISVGGLPQLRRVRLGLDLTDLRSLGTRFSCLGASVGRCEIRLQAGDHRVRALLVLLDAGGAGFGGISTFSVVIDLGFGPLSTRYQPGYSSHH